MDQNQAQAVELFRPRGDDLMTVPSVGLAEIVARTQFAPEAFRGKPGAVLSAMLVGYELGLSPMASLSGIHVINGKPTLSAELMRGLILRAGHHFHVVTVTSTRCTVRGWRREDGPEMATEITWTMDDARRAGLDRNQTYKKYPKAMLAARASAELARLIFADVIQGLGTVEEAEDLEEFAPPADEVVRKAPPAPSGKAIEATVATARPVEADPGGGFASPPIPTADDTPDADNDADEDQEPAGPAEHSPTPAQRIAMAARSADVDRRAVAFHVSDGRTTRASELGADEVRAALACIHDLEAGRYRIDLDAEALSPAHVEANVGAIVPDVGETLADKAQRLAGDAEPGDTPTEPIIDLTGDDDEELPTVTVETMAGDAITVDAMPGDTTTPVPDDDARPDLSTWTQREWLQHLKRIPGVTLGQATQKAIDLATARGITPGSTIVSNPAVRDELYDWTLNPEAGDE